MEKENRMKTDGIIRRWSQEQEDKHSKGVVSGRINQRREHLIFILFCYQKSNQKGETKQKELDFFQQILAVALFCGLQLLVVRFLICNVCFLLLFLFLFFLSILINFQILAILLFALLFPPRNHFSFLLFTLSRNSCFLLLPFFLSSLRLFFFYELFQSSFLYPYFTILTFLFPLPTFPFFILLLFRLFPPFFTFLQIFRN